MSFPYDRYNDDGDERQIIVETKKKTKKMLRLHS